MPRWVMNWATQLSLWLFHCIKPRETSAWICQFCRRNEIVRSNVCQKWVHNSKDDPEIHRFSTLPTWAWFFASLWPRGNTCLVTQSCPTLWDPMDCSPPGSSVHEDSPGNNSRVGCSCPPPGESSHSGIEAWSPALQADSLLSKPP